MHAAGARGLVGEILRRRYTTQCVSVSCRYIEACPHACAGYQLRALLVHETFKKVLYISPKVRGEFSSGRVFNLVTSDAETLQLLTQNIMGLMSSPLRIIVAMAMLYYELGISSLVAFVVLLLLMPTQVLHPFLALAWSCCSCSCRPCTLVVICLKWQAQPVSCAAPEDVLESDDVLRVM